MFSPQSNAGGARALAIAALSLLAATPELTRAAEATASADGAAATDATPANNTPSEVVISAQRLNEARAGIQTQTGASTYIIDSAAIQAMPGGANTQLNQVLLQAPDV